MSVIKQLALEAIDTRLIKANHMEANIRRAEARIAKMKNDLLEYRQNIDVARNDVANHEEYRHTVSRQSLVELVNEGNKLKAVKKLIDCKLCLMDAKEVVEYFASNPK